jgi:hypothetical protein
MFGLCPLTKHLDDSSFDCHRGYVLASLLLYHSQRYRLEGVGELVEAVNRCMNADPKPQNIPWLREIYRDYILISCYQCRLRHNCKWYNTIEYG